MFGDSAPTGDPARDDTWAWDGTRWSVVATVGPPERQWHAMASDAVRGEIVLFGGYQGARSGDTWVWGRDHNPCPADLTTSSDPMDPDYGVPDGMLDAADFFYYLDAFVAGDLGVADLTTSSDPTDPTYGTPDGSLDGSDFFYYLDIFVAGCP